MQMSNYKISELVRGRKKKRFSSVLSHIVRNMKQLLARAHPGYIHASYSLAKKRLNLTTGCGWLHVSYPMQHAS